MVAKVSDRAVDDVFAADRVAEGAIAALLVRNRLRDHVHFFRMQSHQGEDTLLDVGLLLCPKLQRVALDDAELGFVAEDVVDVH